MSDRPPADAISVGKPAAAKGAEQSYDTQLSPDEEKAFGEWKQKYAPNDSGADYDLRGAYKAGMAPDADRGHLPDTFKKPNHPTFSDQSQYSKGDSIGGKWSKKDGKDVFTPSPWNLKQNDPSKLKEYFSRSEPTGILDIADAGPGQAAAGPPSDGIPIKAGKAPATPAAAPPAAPKQKGVIGSALSTAADVPRDIWQDMRKGLKTFKEGVNSPSGGPLNIKPNVEMLGGAAEIAGSLVTGPARALFGDPARKIIPQDNIYGKMAVNTVEDALIMFGPAAAEQFVGKIQTLAGPARTLMENGVQLTLGQISGKYGKRMEEAAKSVPILGSFIRSAENRTFDSWNVATVNKVLKQNGFAEVEGKDAREAATKAEDFLDTKYDQVRAGIPSLHFDKGFSQDVIRLQTEVGELQEGLQNQFDNILNNRLQNRFGSLGAMDGAAFKKADSELRTVSESLRKSDDGQQRELGNYVMDVRWAMRNALRRQYPNIADKLAEVDRAWGQLADIQRAGSSSAVSAGRFTPGQYLQSLKRADNSPRDKEFFKGNRPMQEWGEMAYEVIGNKMPDSGTAERLLWAGRDILGGGAAHFDPTGTVIPTIAGGSALYSPWGQTATNAIARGAPEAAAAAREMSVTAAPAAGAAQQADK